MEDLLISPWQIQQNHCITNLYQTSQKNQQKPLTKQSIKHRCIYTENDDIPYNNSHGLKKLNSINFRKKGQSSSTHQTCYNQRQTSVGSKLQIKLVPYPITQKVSERQKQNISYDIFGTILKKERTSNKSFEVLQTIFDSQLNKTKIFKSNSKLKDKILFQQHNKQNRMNRKTYDVKRREQSNLQSIKKQYRLSYDQNCHSVEARGQNIGYLETLLKQKNDFYKERLTNKHLTNHNHNKLIQPTRNLKKILFYKFQKQISCQLQQKDRLQKCSISRRINQKAKQGYQANKQESTTTQIHNFRQNSYQKLDNINCFKDNRNVFSSLKQKNKILFNELQKYNLFGLRNMKKKTYIKQDQKKKINKNKQNA